MQSNSNSNFKSKILQFIIAILITITTITLFNPIIAFAQTTNSKGYNGTDAGDGATVGKLYWGGSTERTGLLFYIIDESTNSFYTVGGDRIAIAVYPSDRNDIFNDDTLNATLPSMDKNAFYTHFGWVSVNKRVGMDVPDPVYYDEDTHQWSGNNSAVESWLFEEGANGKKNWETLVGRGFGKPILDALQSGMTEDGKTFILCVEPISTQAAYTNQPWGSDINSITLDSDYMEYLDSYEETYGPKENAMKPVLYGSNQILRTCGTGMSISTLNNLATGGSTPTGGANWKWTNQAMPYCMTLAHEQLGIQAITDASPTRRDAGTFNSRNFGYALSMFTDELQSDYISTYNGTATSPAPSEQPTKSEEKDTTGECTITKIYFDIEIENGISKYTYLNTYTTTGTTGFIDITPEKSKTGYSIERWCATRAEATLGDYKHNTEAAYEALVERFKAPVCNNTGTGSIQSLQLNNANSGNIGKCKHLYVLYTKTTIIHTEEPSEYDFELQESQITKRVTFLESSTTDDLISHSFSWSSEAHSPTTNCLANGGYGHHLNCSTEWDVVPVTGVAHNHAASSETSYYKCGYSYSCPAGCTTNHTHHTHSDSCIGYKKLTHTTLCQTGCTTNHTHHFSHTSSCYTVCTKVWDTAPVTGVAHTHSNPCYDTPCSTFAFTDSQVKLGIKLDNTTLNKAVVSKNWGITYDDTETNVVVDDAYFGEFTRTSPDANTISKSNYNAILLLFRGNDKLTLADWKNTTTTTGYLTNIALDSAYNFKSANTPQGSRRAGEEYQETFTAKFINRSPDNQTTYKATVGTHGTCGSTKQYTFTKADGTSSAYTIDNITVNIKVFWANGVSPSTRGTISNNLVAGSASFYPYIRMRYDNNTQNDKKVYVLGQRNRSATFYDYASVSISSSGDPLLSINSNQYYLR